MWPNESLEAAYGSMNAAGDWHFANAPADGPTAAGFMSQLWEGTGKKPIDGVIMIDVWPCVRCSRPLVRCRSRDCRSR